MKVKELMSENPFTVNINTPLRDILEKLLGENTGFIIVTNNNNDIAGIITLSDLFRFVFPNYNQMREHDEYLHESFSIKLRINEQEDKPAKNIMTKFPEVINKEAPVIEAAAIMKDFKVKQLPVVESGKLVGVITSKSIFNNLVSNNINEFSLKS